jgi:predicted glutamine amidotransferase
LCELLGMSANVPTDIVFSFTGLVERGGVTGPHSDGWGITFYDGKGCRSFRDPLPSCKSEVAKLIKNYPIKSKAVISHIRQANRGGVSLENTHPFSRELWGSNWTYAHNGQLSEYERDITSQRFVPVGQTDSELAFCWLLDKMAERFPEQPKSNELFEYLNERCDYLRSFGVFNMLLSNGEFVFAYCSNNLCWITRRAPFGKAKLIDTDVVIDFKKETTPYDVVTVIATKPLTNDEAWKKMSAGGMVMFRYGELAMAVEPQIS